MLCCNHEEADARIMVYKILTGQQLTKIEMRNIDTHAIGIIETEPANALVQHTKRLVKLEVGPRAHRPIKVFFTTKYFLV